MRRLAALASCVLLCACGGDERGAAPDASANPTDTAILRPDAGAAVDGNPGFVPTEPAAPDIPWLDAGPLGPVTSLPVLTPCPPGWREIPPEDELGPATCDPWPEGGMQECADDEAHFPGEPSCTRIGPACPAGDWAEDLPTDRRILHVRAGEPPGGDGTRERPFGGIADALAATTDGDVIALSRGTYAGGLVLGLAMERRIHGACAAGTLLTAHQPSDLTAAIVDVRAGVLELRNVTVSGVRWGVVAQSIGRARLRDVVIARATAAGVAAVGGGRVEADTVVVRDTVDADGATALFAVDGGTMDLRRVVARRNRLGVYATGAGTAVTLRDTLVREITSTAENDGWGLLAGDGATLSASRVSISRAGFAAVSAQGPLLPSTVTLTDADIDEGDVPASPTRARGVHAKGPARIVLQHVRVRRMRAAAILSEGPGGVVEGNDVVAADPRPVDEPGAGLHVARGGSLRLSRIYLARSVGVAVYIDAGTGDLDRLVARDTRPFGPRAQALGLRVAAGGSCTVRGAMLLGNASSDLEVEGVDSRLAAEDVWVRAVSGRGGLALFASDGGHASLRRAVVEGCSGSAVEVDGADAELEDLRVDTCASSASGLFGYGCFAWGGASVTATRIDVRAASELGLIARGPGSRLEIRDGRVASTRERACTGSSCRGLGFGYGVGAYEGASLTLTRFAITDNAFGGVQLANDGTIDLHDGRISGHAIGANVQSTGFDVRRLYDRVLFVDNDVDVDGSALAVPGAPEADP